MKSFKDFVNEKKIPVLGNDKVIPLSGIDKKIANAAIDSGQKDGEKSDDAAPYKKVKIAVKNLKAAQTEIIPEKAIGMAIGMMLGSTLKIGGDLGSIISADNFIMDGHHRWAATYLCDPSASVEGTQIGLDGIPLVSTLNIITKGLHGRNGNPGKGNIADFTGKVIGRIVNDYATNGIPGDYPISADDVKERLGRVPGAKGNWEEGMKLMMKHADMLPKKIMPGAPARIDMPVINPEEVKAAAEMIKNGEVDLTNPFSEETTKAIKERFVSAYVDDVNEAINQSLSDKSRRVTESEQATTGSKTFAQYIIEQKINESLRSDNLINSLQLIDIKLELFHHNTTSFAQHKGFDQIYAEFDGLKDDLIEKIIGYTSERYTSVNVSVDYHDETGLEIVNDLKNLSDVLSKFAKDNKYHDLKNLSDSISGLSAKMNYLLTLK